MTPKGTWHTAEHRAYTKSVCDVLRREAARQGISTRPGDDQSCVIGGQEVYVSNHPTDEFDYSTSIEIGSSTFTVSSLEEAIARAPEFIRVVKVC